MDPGKEEQENEEEMEFSQGVLSHLECLERRERGRAVLREQRERQRERSEMLRAKIRELEQHRDSLRGKLQALAQDPAGSPWEPRDVLLWRIRQLQELLKLFPLTGICGRLSRHGAWVSLHTSWEGSLLDAFALELRPSPGARQLRLRLGRHGLPPWLPLHGLAPHGLPADARALLEEFSDCIQGIPCSNSLCNLLSFQCRLPGGNSRIPGKNSQISEENPQNPQISGENWEIPGNVLEFRARLLYGDPLRSLPTDVQISMEGIAEPPPWVAQLLRSRSLPRALRAIRHRNSQGNG
ncbi:centromere protein O [Ammospiza caudacuta]|uniref:centromere protein O n=1 Tax=Ammospiza caudacuta TaxID=2857398 RepID=UPI00273A1CD1|nr:centromere protein O [Ammospiza caudacuta]